jgi:hypothetical protein
MKRLLLLLALLAFSSFNSTSYAQRRNEDSEIEDCKRKAGYSVSATWAAS